MESSRYVCYMLRLWQAGTDEGSAWRGSLEDVYSGGRLGFATLGELCAFLVATTCEGVIDRPRVEEKDQQ